MPRIKSTIWEIEPHTEAKHVILGRYLYAWLPIITRWNGRIVYIDGFAGPGEYIGGKDGSPIIAIKAVLDHRTNIKSKVVMLFIEADKKRCKFLEEKIAKIKLPSNLRIEYKCKKFEEALKEIFDYLDEQKTVLAPSFVFIDPFGFSGMPMAVIKRIMENDKCEVLITFMYEEINRFISHNNLEESFNEMFGTDEWKTVIGEEDPVRRNNLLHGIYKKQLESEAGIKYVRSFKMINKTNRTDYYLFFGTNNIVGLKKMKAAMWKVDELGQFQFSDATYDPAQPMLFELEPDFSILKKLILKRFKGKTISVVELENFIVLNTPYRETHYKKQILASMEKADFPEIEVKCMAGKRRKGSFTNSCVIKFL